MTPFTVQSTAEKSGLFRSWLNGSLRPHTVFPKLKYHFTVLMHCVNKPRNGRSKNSIHRKLNIPFGDNSRLQQLESRS